MGKVYAIVNQKGGVGKTTTNINLASCLAYMGKKVLTIDIDAQGNTTSGLGVDKNCDSIYECMIEGLDPHTAIKHTKYENLDILPANMDLAGGEVELVTLENREYKLKNVIDQIKDEYDYVLLDCPPSLGLVTLNALIASDAVLVPLQCEYYALEGLSQLIETVQAVKGKFNPSLYIEGVVLTMYDNRTKLSVQVANEISKHFGEVLYKTYIPRNVRLGEAPSFAKSIIDYDKRSLGALRYMQLAEEFVKRSEK